MQLSEISTGAIFWQANDCAGSSTIAVSAMLSLLLSVKCAKLSVLTVLISFGKSRHSFFNALVCYNGDISTVL